jgi:hypothetical protein
MFSLFFHSFPRKGRLPVLVSPPVLFVLCLLAGTVLFTGCPNPAGGTSFTVPTDLKGEWVGTDYGETYTITDTTFTTDSYGGTIANVILDGADAGWIIIKYTFNTYLTEQGYEDVSGRYFAVRFENLTPSSVDICGAYSANDTSDGEGGVTGKATLAEAEAAYTAPGNDYFGWFSSCAK